MWPTLIAFSVLGGLAHPIVPRQGNVQPPRRVDLEAQRRNANEGADRINDMLKKIVECHDESIRRWQDRINQLRADGVAETAPLMVSAKEALVRYQQWRIQMSSFKANKIGK